MKHDIYGSATCFDFDCLTIVADRADSNRLMVAKMKRHRKLKEDVIIVYMLWCFMFVYVFNVHSFYRILLCTIIRKTNKSHRFYVLRRMNHLKNNRSHDKIAHQLWFTLDWLLFLANFSKLTLNRIVHCNHHLNASPVIEMTCTFVFVLVFFL